MCRALPRVHLSYFLVTLFACTWVASAHAGQADRKGIQFYFGMNGTLLPNWGDRPPPVNPVPGEDYSAPDYGVGATFALGYGLTNVDCLRIFNTAIIAANEGRHLRGLAWHHYFGSTGQGWFTFVGLGSHAWDYHTDGIGFKAGAGYEYIRHLQVELGLLGGFYNNERARDHPVTVYLQFGVVSY